MACERLIPASTPPPRRPRRERPGRASKW